MPSGPEWFQLSVWFSINSKGLGLGLRRALTAVLELASELEK